MWYYKILVLRLVLSFLWALSRNFLASFVTPLSAYLSYFPFLLLGASVDGNILSFGSSKVEFVDACSALGAYILLGLLVLLTKDVSFWKGVKVFLLGCLMILIANIIRIDLMIIILENYGMNLFETLHMVIWKFVSVVYVALVWIFLVWKFKIKNIPLWSDLKYLYKNSIFH